MGWATSFSHRRPCTSSITIAERGMCPTTHQRPSWTLNRAAEDRLSAPLSRSLRVNCTDSPRLDDTTTTTTSASRQTRPSPSPSPRPVVAPPTQTISQQTHLTLPNPPATIHPCPQATPQRGWSNLWLCCVPYRAPSSSTGDSSFIRAVSTKYAP